MCAETRGCPKPTDYARQLSRPAVPETRCYVLILNRHQVLRDLEINLTKRVAQRLLKHFAPRNEYERTPQR